MANKNSNYPTNQLNNLSAGVSSDTITCLNELAVAGKPKTEAELKQRMDRYFNFCAEHDFRCGIESLCLALGTNRMTFWNWCNGRGCERNWQELCLMAKQMIITFIEQISLTGKLNPATSCFMLKNWASYQDSVVIERAPDEDYKRPLSVEELPKLSEFVKDNKTVDDLPKLSD